MAGNLNRQFDDEIYTNISVTDNSVKKTTQNLSNKTIIRPTPKRAYTKINIFIMCLAFGLLLIEALVYLHCVNVEVNANKKQSQIVQLKEENYFLSVDLEKNKELTKVEEQAKNLLDMTPSTTAQINYLMMPSFQTKKEYLVTKAEPVREKMDILIGY